MNLFAMEQTLNDKYYSIKNEWSKLLSSQSHWEAVLSSAQSRMDEIYKEQDLIERTSFALKQARPLLSQSSIKDCEKLANLALSSVFNSDSTVEWSYEEEQFVLLHPEGYRTLLSTEGGGYLCVISFVFQVYLIMKLRKRRFICLDEFFTCISSEYLENFLTFVKQLCNDLSFTVILITHDSRIEERHADHLFVIDDGKSHKVK